MRLLLSGCSREQDSNLHLSAWSGAHWPAFLLCYPAAREQQHRLQYRQRFAVLAHQLRVHQEPSEVHASDSAVGRCVEVERCAFLLAQVHGQPCLKGCSAHSGRGRIRTFDLQPMKLASYQTALPLRLLP